jgi:hypothetical protein
MQWSDDELWRAIAHNTDTMSTLLLDELKQDDSEINPCTRTDLVLFVNSQYSDYTGELRRRHHCLDPVGGSISTSHAGSLTPSAQPVTKVGETMPSDADFYGARIDQLMAAAPKHRKTVTEKRGATKILVASLARCATVPALIQYGVVAALISVIVGALDYGYGPYDHGYTAAPLYDYAGPASPAPVHAAPPGYGPLVYTPQAYAPTSTTSLSLMIFSALFMGGASLAVAQNWPAAGGQLPVAGGAASKPAAPKSVASTPARTAQHHGAPHDRMYMMLVKAPVKVQIDAR